jgi:hypothetical protein
VFVQEAKKCFEEALERATAEAEEDEKYYKLIAITIRLEFNNSQTMLWIGIWIPNRSEPKLSAQGKIMPGPSSSGSEMNLK